MKRAWYYRYIDHLPFVLLIVATAGLPLFYVSGMRDPFVLSKTAWLIGWTIAACFAWLTSILVRRTIQIRRTFLDVPLVLFVVFAAIAAGVSWLPYDSLIGRADTFVLTFPFLLALCVYIWMLIQEVSSVQRWQGVLHVLFITHSITIGLFLFSTLPLLQGIYIPQFLEEAVSGFSAVHLSFYSAIVSLLAFGVLMHKERYWWMKIIPCVSALLGFIAVLVMNISSVLWLCTLGMLLLVFLGWAEARRMHLFTLFVMGALAMATGFFALRSVPEALTIAVVPEVRVSHTASWEVVMHSLTDSARSFLVGYGPGTFESIFVLHRPTPFLLPGAPFDTSFVQPYSTIHALMSELGFFASLAFLLFAGVLVWATIHSLHILYKDRRSGLHHRVQDRMFDNTSRKDDMHIDGIVVASIWLIVTLGLFVYSYDVLLWGIWALFSALTIVGLSAIRKELIRLHIKTILLTSQHTVLLIFVVTASLVLLGLGIQSAQQVFKAEQAYAQATRVSDTEASRAYITVALTHTPDNRIYKQALAETYLEAARRSSAHSDPDLDTVARLLAQGSNEAQQLTQAYPKSVQAWQILASLYINARPVVADANGWAEDALMQARDLDPTNPRLAWQLGLTYQFAGSTTQAIEAYTEALSLRKDFIPAYINLAETYEADNAIDEAVQVYITMAELGLEPATAYYEQGRLLFNRNQGTDVKRAEEAWLAAINEDLAYANALYSLGLLYERLGNIAEAKNYYHQVLRIHPENVDVQQRINSL